MNGIIEVSTGYLLRAGFCSFTAGSGEEVRTDVPEPPHVKHHGDVCVHRWTGTAWEVVTDLDEVKREKYVAIDARTEEIISQGFYFGDPVAIMSNSANAQRTWNGMAIMSSSLSYPVTVPSLYDDTNLVLQNETETLQFYGVAVSAVRAGRDGGSALKDQVRAATTKEQVDAVEDNRPIQPYTYS